MQQSAAAPAASNRDRLVGYLSVAGVLSLFTSFILVSRLGMEQSLTVMDLAALRFGIGGLILAPVVLRHGLSGLAWWRAAILASVGGLIFAQLAYAGFLLAPASHGTAFLHGSLPLFTYLVLLALPGVRPDRRALPGVLAIALGVLLLAWDSLVEVSAEQLLGDGLLCLAGVLWSVYGVLAGRWGLPAIRSAAIVATLSMCAYLPIYALLPGPGLLAADWRQVLLQGLFQGVLIGVVSILLYTRAVTSLGAAQVALCIAAVPGLVTLLAIPVLGEWPSLTAVAGVAAVTLGMLLALRRPGSGRTG